MSAGTQPTLFEATEAVPFDRLYRLSVDQYQQMAEAGILTLEDRVEFLDGLIYLKPAGSYGRPDRLYRLSVGQYHEMARLGILAEGAPIELLDGWLVTKMPIKPSHRISTHSARVALERVTPAGWYVDQQNPVLLGNSEPEPDISVVRGDTRDYRDRHPGPEDVALVIEVSEATLGGDRKLKKPLYARAGIPVYWIVNIRDRQIEVYTEPSGPADLPDYHGRQDYGPMDAVPLVIEGREVTRLAVAELLP